MAPAHHGVKHLACGRTTEKLFPLLIALRTLFVDARRSSKTPRPEKVTKVARKSTETYSVDWRPKSAFEMMYFFYQARYNHAPKILGVQRVTRPKHVKLHAPGVQFGTPRACCTTLLRTRMQTATSETETKSLDLSICVDHYTLRAPCPKGHGTSQCQLLSITPAT